MNNTKLFLFLVAVSLLSCRSTKQSTMQTGPKLDLQAHRGGRGLMPENTIPAMKNAIALGITTLEMDAVISKDNKVVVSHDPYFNDLITTTPEGTYLTKKEASQRLLYQLPYDSIRKYDVGIKPHPDFPRQKKIRTYKPLLAELVDSAEAAAAAKGARVLYNIEVKSKEGFDGIRHPEPATFCELVLQVIRDKKILERCTIQSFDVRPLQYIHSHHPEVVLSYLVENSSGTLDQQLAKLGFTPAIYSPLSGMVTRELVTACHQKGMKVIPWTVNTVAEMKKLVDMGVDGMISDYPDLYAQLPATATK